MKKNTLLGLLVLVLVFSFIGCGNGSSAGDKEFSVTFDPDGGKINGKTTSVKINVKSGETIENLPNPEKADNDFDGWYTQKNGKGAQFTKATAVTSNLTVYAKWTSNVDKNMYVYNIEGTKYTGSGNITAFNGYGTAHNHGIVGQINNGILDFALPLTIPLNELNGDTIKITSLIFECNGMSLFLVNPVTPSTVYFVYSSSNGNFDVSGVTLNLSKGWNVCEALFDTEGPVLTGKILTNSLEAVYGLGYDQWSIFSMD